MDEDESFQFKLKVDPVKMTTTLDGADIIDTLAVLKLKVRAHIAACEMRIEYTEVYLPSYINDLKLEIAKQQGYIAALSAVSFLCGYDNYFHRGKPCEEAFNEVAEHGIEQPKIWPEFKELL